MISKEKSKLLFQYDKPIIWNVSIFGNVSHMYLLDVILKDLEDLNLPNPINTIHGSYSCKYNGGRVAINYDTRTNIEYKIKKYNKQGIGIKLTFSNMNIHKEQFEEEEMRWYLDLLNETKGIGNGIICVNDDFGELVKKNYPDLDLVASHVKMEMETKLGETDTIDYYNSKFDLYDIVVMNTFRAFDDDFLSKITHPEKVEFIVNHVCTANCPMVKYHHNLIEDLQNIYVKYDFDKKKILKSKEYIDINDKINKQIDKCLNIKHQILKNKDFDNIRKQHINKEEINYLNNTYGINHFKIEGRDLSTFDIITAIRNYMINDELMLDISQYDSIVNIPMPNNSKKISDIKLI